jgi:dTDP-4-dehydrorhamnose reductase
MTHAMAERPVLVTGGRGLLGRSLGRLSSPDRPVVVAGRSELDITDAESIARAIDRIRPSAIVNAAAMTDVDGCERDPDAATRANATGPGLLASACALAGVPLVQVSTDFVFDGRKREPYTTLDEPNPISVYGRSKLAGERAVFSAMPDAFVVRTSWLFGVGGKNFASRIFDYAATSSRLKGIVDMKSLPTYAPDLSDRILEILHTGASGTFHVTGSGDPATWFDVARAALDAAGRFDVELVPVTVAELGLPAPRPAYSAMRCLQSETLGLSPLRRWNDAVKAFVREVGAEAKQSPK